LLLLQFQNSAGFQNKKHNLKTQCLITLFLLQSFWLVFLLIFAIQYTTFGTLWISNPSLPQSDSLCLLFWQKKHLIHRNYWNGGYIGLSINPQSILSTNFYNEDSLKFSAMGLGVALVLWSIYTTKIELKKAICFFWLLVYT
jgi:hypothetical protein